MSDGKDQAAVNMAMAREASEPDIGTGSSGHFGDQMQPKQGEGPEYTFGNEHDA